MMQEQVLRDEHAGPLALRVLDLSGAIGSYCSKLLADLGADVVLVEPPQGDPFRNSPPIVQLGNGEPKSAVFAAYNANKRGVSLDVTHPDSLPLLEALGSTADVVIASPTARNPVIGFDRERPGLSWARPEALVATITPFGLTGPLRDLRMTPFLSFAMTGGMHRVGDPDGPPRAIPGQLAWDEAGIHAALGILAVLSSPGTGGGQVLDLSVHEVGAAKDFLLERYDVGRQDEWGRAVAVGIPPTGIWACADGPLAVAVHQEHHWDAFLDMLGHPDELADPAYADPLFRREVHDLMEALIAPLMAPHRRLDLFRLGQEARLPCAPYNSPGEYLGDMQPTARKTFVSSGGVSIPWRWGHSSPRLLSLRRPAPAPGEHNHEVYVDELGFTAEDLASWKKGRLV